MLRSGPHEDAMHQQPDAVGALRAKIWPMACLFLLGMMLSACDRCGDFWPTRSDIAACKNDMPRQQ